MKKKIQNTSYKGIRKVEDEYGLVLFRCSLTHLIDVGHKHLQDKKLIKETCETIQKETKPNAIMTADFQCAIVECAEELAKSKKQFIEDYENDPLVQAGWTFQDNWEMSHFNQR